MLLFIITYFSAFVNNPDIAVNDLRAKKTDRFPCPVILLLLLHKREINVVEVYRIVLVVYV